MTLTIGCSEDKKIEKTPVKTTEKVVAIPKIKTVDELFVAIEEKFKDYNFEYPLITFATIEGGRNNGKSKAISYRKNPIDKAALIAYIEVNGKVTFYTSEINNRWLLIANKKLLKNNDAYKYVNTPDLIIKNKTNIFRKFFKELHLSKDIVKVRGNNCYKLTTITNKNNPLNENVTYTYWFDCNTLLKIKEKYPAKIGSIRVVQENHITYKLINGQYKEYQSSGYSIIKNSNQPKILGVITTNKVVENAPMDESLFKCPKDKHDYKKLQTYFNGLLKKYYDNKYQIKIK